MSESKVELPAIYVRELILKARSLKIGIKKLIVRADKKDVALLGRISYLIGYIDALAPHKNNHESK